MANDPRLQWRQLSQAQPNVSGLMAQVRGGINDAASAAEGILGRYQEGQQAKGDQELARLLASATNQEELTSLVNSDAVRGLNLSEEGVSMLNEAQGNRVDWMNTRGRLKIANDMNARQQGNWDWTDGLRREKANLADEVVAARLEGQRFGSKGAPRDVQTEAIATMREIGYPDHVIEGFLMNYQDESGFQPDIEEGEPNVHGTRGKGIYQLTGDRRKRFEQMFNGDWSVRNQILFQDWELNNTESAALDAIFGSKNAGEAGANIVNKFLRPAAEYATARTAKYTRANGFDVGAASSAVSRGTPARDILAEALANSQYLSFEDVNSIMTGSDTAMKQGDTRLAEELEKTQKDLLATFVTEGVANHENISADQVAQIAEDRALASGKFTPSQALDARRAIEEMISESKSLQSELAPAVQQSVEDASFVENTMADQTRRFEGKDYHRAIGDIERYAEDPTANLEEDLGISSDGQTPDYYDSNRLKNYINKLATEFNVEPAVMAVAMRDSFLRDPGDDGAWWELDFDMTRNTIENRFDREKIGEAIKQLSPASRMIYDEGRTNLKAMEQELKNIESRRKQLLSQRAKTKEGSAERAAYDAQLLALSTAQEAVLAKRRVKAKE